MHKKPTPPSPGQQTQKIPKPPPAPGEEVGAAISRPARGEQYARATAVLQAATPEAAKALVDLLSDDDAKVRLQAAQSILDRTLGRPRPSDDDSANSMDAHAKLTLLVSKLTVDQLIAVAVGPQPTFSVPAPVLPGDADD